MPEWLGWLQFKYKGFCSGLEPAHAQNRPCHHLLGYLPAPWQDPKHVELCGMTEISAGLQWPSLSLPPGLSKHLQASAQCAPPCMGPSIP